MSKQLQTIFNGKTVLVTGHTGFKGSWLSIWLCELGANVVGFSQNPPTKPNLFSQSQLATKMIDIRGDVRDLDHVQQTINEHQPDFVFHLAAQPLVLASYTDPVETMGSNVMGTVNVLEGLRKSDFSKPITAVFITTDKVYQNQEWDYGYRENDRLGGHDPYSSSKAMAELAIASYRDAFFPAHKLNEHQISIASARAGNVIGGGDFSPNRLVPDCMRALMADTPITLRNPNHVRPWQHVLESLSGYLWLAANMAEGNGTYNNAWNFGPHNPEHVTTAMLADEAVKAWGKGSWQSDMPVAEKPKETTLLMLNTDRAANKLKWSQTWSWQVAIEKTADWFKQHQTEPQDIYPFCVTQIEQFTEDAHKSGNLWAQGQL